jgi:hypothetical protein
LILAALHAYYKSLRVHKRIKKRQKAKIRIGPGQPLSLLKRHESEVYFPSLETELSLPTGSPPTPQTDLQQMMAAV